MGENAKGLIKERKKFIKESEQYLTSFERFSDKMLSILYKCIFLIVLPFVLLIFLVDGFNFSVLVFLGIIFFIFVPIMRQNEKRLEVLIKSRMEMEGHTIPVPEEKERPNVQQVEQREKTPERNEVLVKEKKEEESFVIPATSINMGSNSFFLTFLAFFMTVLLYWIFGWGSLITKSFLFGSIALLVFSFWFPYSKFVERRVEINGERVKIGKRDLFYREFKEIICRDQGNIIEFHLTYTNEPINIRPEEAFRQEMREYLKGWCNQVGISFTDLSK